ncbi:hypothetical protein C0J45_7951, partial [Silurus meridionalis]
CPRFITGKDSHDRCVVCLGVEHAQSALEGVECSHCSRMAMRTLRSRRALFERSSLPRGSGPALSEAKRRRRSWGSQADLAAELESDESASASSAELSFGSIGEAGPMAASSPGTSSAALHVSLSEEGELMDASEPVEPSQPVLYEELLEVVTRAVAKLDLAWPVKQQRQRAPSKLDERFLRPVSLPRRRGLLFFPDLHAEVSSSWETPYSARASPHHSSIYANVVGAKACGYGAMPRVEETLASYLSPSVASSLKAPVFPTKPLRATSALVGKAYAAAGQAAGCLHTMGVLQAYQADLLHDLDEGLSSGATDIKELRRTADLTLRATKHTARAVGRSMAALVATERHLWLTLSDLPDKDRAVLLNAPMAPPGLFGDAVTAVVNRFQGSKKQSAAFQQYLPRRSRGAGRRQPQPG